MKKATFMNKNTTLKIEKKQIISPNERKER